MPKILSFNGVDPKDLKQNPIKALWEWFQSQDKFIKSTVIVTAILVISTPIIVKTILTLNQHASNPTRRLVMGIAMKQGRDRGDGVQAEIDEIENFKNQVGQYPGSYSIWTKLSGDKAVFPDTTLLSYLDSHNITSVIFMESDPFYNTDVASGSHDEFFRTWAQAAKAYGKKVILRYDQEMNAPAGWNWFDYWAHDPVNFKNSWIHMHDVIRGEGATNVEFFWCPWATDNWGVNNMNDYYPGDSYVDYVGFDAYSGFDGRPHVNMQDLYGPAIAKLDSLYPTKRIIIGETGIDDSPKNIDANSFPAFRSQWVTQGYDFVYNNWPHVVGIIYLNFSNSELGEGERDWKMDTSPEIVTAYAQVAADPRFQGSFTPPIVVSDIKKIPASEDTYVNEAKPNGNFNHQNYLIAGDTPKRLAYLKFDIPSLSITDAKLALTVGEGKFAASDATFKLKEITDNTWKENVVTYSTRPAAGNILKKFKGAANGATIEIDLTDYVKTKQGQTVSFSVGTTNSDWLTIQSGVDSKPTLIITYEKTSGSPQPRSDPAAPTGSIIASPISCTIPSGETSCLTTITWNSQNASNVSVGLNGNGPGSFQNGASGSVSSGVAVGNTSFTLYSGGTVLSQVTVTANKNAAPTGSITDASPNPCTMAWNAAGCRIHIAWSAQNTDSIFINGNGGTRLINNLPSGEDYVTLPEGVNTLKLFTGNNTDYLLLNEVNVDVIRNARPNPTGSIEDASPNPCNINWDSEGCRVHLSWNTQNTSEAFVNGNGGTRLANGTSGDTNVTLPAGENILKLFAGNATDWTLLNQVIFSVTSSLPPAPTNFYPTSGAITAGSKVVTWSAIPGATGYALRIDDTVNGWTGSCSSLNSGDACDDNVVNSSYPYNFQVGHSYRIWVHTKGKNNWSDSGGVTVSVPAPSGTISVNPKSCVIQPGETSCLTTITWNSQNASNVSVGLNGNGPGSFQNGASGSVSSGVAAGNTSFTLYSGGTVLSQVTVTATKNSPKGYHDGATCDISYGWVCDPDNYSQPLNVHIYKDGQAGKGGTIIGNVTANIDRQDLITNGNVCGGTKNHGFNFSMPASMKDGKSHSLYAYGINIGNSGENKLLNNSPKVVNCSQCKAPLAPNAINLSGNITAGKRTFTWSSVSGVSRYALRINNLANPWTGTCSSVNAGDVCNNNVLGTSFTYNFQKDHRYTIWVHAVAACGGYSGQASSVVRVPSR